MTPEKLSRWKKLAEAATEGPWTYSGYFADAHFGIDPLFFYSQGETDFPKSITEDDLSFIAEARTAVPELIAEVERLQRELEDAKDEIQFWLEELNGP